MPTGEQEVRIHPLTGQQTPWNFIRPGHHCGALSASAHMMFFRSGFTAYYDLDEDSGTRHFAGHRLGCWINFIPAGGLVIVPEASAGCACLFSLTATVVFQPRENRQVWGVYTAEGSTTPVRHMALNLGAPGDRRDVHGKLWLGYPRPASRRDWICRWTSSRSPRLTPQPAISNTTASPRKSKGLTSHGFTRPA